MESWHPKKGWKVGVSSSSTELPRLQPTIKGVSFSARMLVPNSEKKQKDTVAQKWVVINIPTKSMFLSMFFIVYPC